MKAAQLGIVLLGLTSVSCAEGEGTTTDIPGTGTGSNVSPPGSVSPPQGTAVAPVNPGPDPSSTAEPEGDSSAPTPPFDASTPTSERDAASPAPDGADASDPSSTEPEPMQGDAAVSPDAGGPPEPPPPCDGRCDDDEHCQRSTDMCVECLGDSHCGEESVCEDNACVPIIPCETSEECESTTPVCHSELDRCVMCEIDLDCPETETCADYRCVDPAEQCLRGDDPCAASSIIEMPGEQLVDGFGDEFCQVPGFELNFSNAARGAADLPHSALVRVAWTEDAFHIFAEVEDPDVATNQSIDSLWSGDVLELYLATSAASALSGLFTGRVDGVQLVFAPPSANNPARAARLFWIPNEDNPDSWRQVREEFTQDFAARATDNGYAIEARIPWSSFGPRAPEVESGTVIAFNVGLATANAQSIQDDAREGAAVLFVGEPTEGTATCEGEQLPWCNSTTWCSPTLE